MYYYIKGVILALMTIVLFKDSIKWFKVRRFRGDFELKHPKFYNKTRYLLSNDNVSNRELEFERNMFKRSFNNLVAMISLDNTDESVRNRNIIVPLLLMLSMIVSPLTTNLGISLLIAGLFVYLLLIFILTPLYKRNNKWINSIVTSILQFIYPTFVFTYSLVSGFLSTHSNVTEIQLATQYSLSFTTTILGVLLFVMIAYAVTFVIFYILNRIKGYYLPRIYPFMTLFYLILITM